MNGRRAFGFVSIASSLIVLLAAAPSPADPGDPDSTFGRDGLVRVPGREFHPLDVAMQPNGKILVLGVGDSYYKIWIARLTPRGRLDRRYGNDGFANAFLLGSVEESLGGMTADRNGRAVVVTGEPDSVILARRYTHDGYLDRSFGGDGSASTGFAMHFLRAGDAVAVRSVIAGGFAGRFDDRHGFLTLARFRPDGSLDPTFGGDGRVVHRFCCWRGAPEIAADATGRVVVGGMRSATGLTGLTRVLLNGPWDRSFSGDGRIRLPVGLTNLADVAVSAGGDIAVVGAPGAEGPHWHLARFLPDGRPDPGFGGDGFVTTTISCSDLPSDVLLLDDGKVLVTGTVKRCRDGARGRPVIARYLADGRLDPAFGDGGLVFLRLAGAAFQPARAPDDKIVLLAQDRVARLLP